MTLNGAIMQLVEMRENSMMPEVFKPYLDKVIETVSECEVPFAQPEIVRCKDCKFWREHKYAKGTKRYIPFCGLNAIYTKSDDFCSKGERRTDE